MLNYLLNHDLNRNKQVTFSVESSHDFYTINQTHH